MIDKLLFKEWGVKKSYIPACIVNSILSAAFTAFNAFFLASIVNMVFMKHEGINSIKLYLVALLINAACKFIVNMALETHIKDRAEDIKESIKQKSIKHLTSSTPNKVKEQNLGEVITLLSQGAEMLTPYYSEYMPQFLSSILVPLVLLICTLFVDRLSALIMLVTYPLIPMFMILIGKKSKELNEKQWKKLTVLSSHFLDMLQGIRTLKLFGKSKLQEKKVFEISESYRHSTISVLRISFLSALVLETASTICTALVAVDLGLRLTYSKISFFNAFFILILTPEFYLPMRQLGAKFHASLNGSVAMEKLQLLQDSLNTKKNISEKNQLRGKAVSVEINNLSFSHKEKEALNNVSFKINSGEKVALIGESGSGKSTLIDILSGFIKVEDGSVFINNIDINRLDHNDYLNKISLVPQFPHIFNMNLKDNIVLGSNRVSQKEFEKVCELTKVDEFSKQFTNQYETLIGDGEAVVLSGGEKQRIALARALVKNSELIILDEPTSALDADTEELVPKLIYEELEDKTVLIAAHRLNTVKDADKILVLHQGTIVEAGTHEELLAYGGRYFSMIKTLEVQQ